MKRFFSYLVFFSAFLVSVSAQDSIIFKGQASVWLHVNPNAELPGQSGARYIQTVQYLNKFKNSSLLDFEVSANLYGSAAFNPFDSLNADAKIKPYRAWMRYSTNQFELRLGLQKINFGQASMLRPLMWFDQLDPRDPLQLTDGVYGLLARYYFLNNANLWLWGLMGNNRSKAWEIGVTRKNKPEFGGRFQVPVPAGEAALSYHYRKVDSNLPGLPVPVSDIPENRIGLDAKWDLGVGLWFEASWIHKNRPSGLFTNQHFITAGTDYTFGWGNGLNVVYEQMLISFDEKPFGFSGTTSFSAVSASYPLGISDNLGTIFYYDWRSGNIYSFFNWKHQFSKFYMYLIGYMNPKNYSLPQQGSSSAMFTGKGFQIMFVYNH